MKAIKLSTNKLELLESRGYEYNFLRQLYFNRVAKKAFSVEFVQERPLEKLEDDLMPIMPGKEWQLFFNSPQSEEVKRELIHFLDSCKSPAICTSIKHLHG